MTITTPKRFSIAEYHRLAELGFFAENDRFELIKGDIVKMVAKGTAHSVCNTLLERELFKLLGERATVRVKEPIIIPNDSEPEPDLVIAKNRDDDYLSFTKGGSDRSCRRDFFLFGKCDSGRYSHNDCLVRSRSSQSTRCKAD